MWCINLAEVNYFHLEMVFNLCINFIIMSHTTHASTLLVAIHHNVRKLQLNVFFGGFQEQQSPTQFHLTLFLLSFGLS